MFGHDDHDDDNNQPQAGHDLTADTGAGTGVGPTPPPPPADSYGLDSPGTQTATEPPQDSSHDDQTVAPDHQLAEDSINEHDDYGDQTPAADNDSDGLLGLKKQALEELSPLIDHLEQTPEEKFKTTMMMIQATDSANLVKVAFEAAQQIEDEKDRAQALLDIVNEINYFTQK